MILFVIGMMDNCVFFAFFYRGTIVLNRYLIVISIMDAMEDREVWREDKKA